MLGLSRGLHAEKSGLKISPVGLLGVTQVRPQILTGIHEDLVCDAQAGLRHSIHWLHEGWGWGQKVSGS